MSTNTIHPLEGHTCVPPDAASAAAASTGISLRDPAPLKVHRVASSGLHTAVVTTDGGLWVTGSNSAGQLGADDSLHHRAEFAQVQLPRPVRDVAVAPSHTVALDVDGVLWVAGVNLDGALGTGDSPGPDGFCALEGLPPFVSVFATEFHSAAVTAAGELWVTGRNSFGGLGFGDTESRFTFTPVPDLPPVAHVALTKTHTLVATRAGGLWVAGSNVSSVLGLRSDLHPTRFTRVSGVPAAATVATAGLSSFMVDTAGGLWVTSVARHIAGPTAHHDGLFTRADHLPPLRSVCSTVYQAVALDTSGAIWTLDVWGVSSGARFERCDGPAAMPPVAYLAVAPDGSMFAVGLDGRLWVQGRNDVGQLGCPGVAEQFCAVDVGSLRASVAAQLAEQDAPIVDSYRLADALLESH